MKLGPKPETEKEALNIVVHLDSISTELAPCNGAFINGEYKAYEFVKQETLPGGRVKLKFSFDENSNPSLIIDADLFFGKNVNTNEYCIVLA